MRALCLALAFVLSAPLAAQEPAKKKKAAPKKQQVAHKKATPEQIRKFNELQKKQQQETKR